MSFSVDLSRPAVYMVQWGYAGDQTFTSVMVDHYIGMQFLYPVDDEPPQTFNRAIITEIGFEVTANTTGAKEDSSFSIGFCNRPHDFTFVASLGTTIPHGATGKFIVTGSADIPAGTWPPSLYCQVGGVGKSLTVKNTYMKIKVYS